MKNRKDRKNKVRTLLLVTFMGVGFALISAQLTIMGNGIVRKTSWDVHFQNIQVLEGSVETTQPTISNDGTTVDYTVVLDLPGDFYEFTVDVVNNGSVDAILSSLMIDQLGDESRYAIDYTVTYLDGRNIYEHDVLKSNTTTTYKVSLRYRDNVGVNDIIADPLELDLSITAIYEQSRMKDREDQSYFTQLVRDNAFNDRSLNFKESLVAGSVSNGFGLYVRAGTEEDVHPIYYYRGNVDNNNAIFAGYCWKIVRTTEKGGTKLIYNGRPGDVYPNPVKLESDSYNIITNDVDYPYEYNATTKEWQSTSDEAYYTSQFSFSVEEAGDYYINYKMITSSSDSVRFYLDDEQIAYNSVANKEDTIALSNVTPSSVIRVQFYQSWGSSGKLSFSVISDMGQAVTGCPLTNEESTQISSTTFNSSTNSPAYVGYMYGTVYTTSNTQVNYSSNYVYGNSFTYSNGTYTLVDTVYEAADKNHHYTCLSTSKTCSTIYYVFYKQQYSSYDRDYYISLTGGKSVEDALADMNRNTNNSVVKNTIDTWFSGQFVSYFNNMGKNYNNYLEDAVWCNDRSVNTSEARYINNGWKPDEGNLQQYLYYGGNGRRNLGVVDLGCPNKSDAFTVSDTINGNGALTYPVGLLTADELMLAGKDSNANYLYTERYWWTMTPNYYESYSNACNYTGVSDYSSAINSKGVRPSIVVAKNVRVASGGDGTKYSPYQFIVE